MKLSHLHSVALLGAALAAFTLAGCVSERGPVAPAGGGDALAGDAAVALPAPWHGVDLENLTASPEGIKQVLHGGSVVFLDGGSVDALQGAIDAAGSGGVVVVRSGSHTEHSTVNVTAPVAILGQRGAVMYFDTAADPLDHTIVPGLWVQNTETVMIAGLEMRPVTAPGNAAIVIENSSSVAVVRSAIYDHQNAVLIHKGAGNVVARNTIVASNAWLTGEIAEADGVINANGTGTVIQGNDISSGVFGIFAADAGGSATRNTLHDCLYGLICCRIPAGSFELPDGEIIGSETSCTQWSVRRNYATANILSGIIVIDGANLNTVQGNNCPANGTYGIELVGESTRFGFCTPTCFDNTVIAAPFNDTVIKDCGQNDTITGGQLVDTSQDPCDPPCPLSASAPGAHRIAVQSAFAARIAEWAARK